MTDKLKEKVAQLPNAPGVYLFKDASGAIVYIGKAKSLKKRAQSYFSRPQDSKNQVMVSKIRDIEYRLTPSQAQAQILEASLIKEYQPQYNIDLKDDKSFPWIRITDEKFPIVSIYRKKGKHKIDHSVYFGPYTNVKLLRQAVKVMRRIFGFRSCKNLPKKPCLYYRLKLCPAPCIGRIATGDYKEIIQQIKLFLESRYEELLQKLAQKMQKVAQERRFEEAAKIRDQLNALSAIGQSQTGFSRQFELEDLRELLKLDKLPERIEAFDISNILGKEATGSMVSFFKGLADKNNYRRFRIKTVAGIDDYDMLREVIRRRYSRLLAESLTLPRTTESHGCKPVVRGLPDLVLIDGGRAHLLAAHEELKKLGMSLALVSIAKERENIYTIEATQPIKFKQDTPALNLIRRIRDEAHRFAVSYHHILRRKKVIGK